MRPNVALKSFTRIKLPFENESPAQGESAKNNSMKKQNKDILRKKGLELMNLWRADWNRFVREALGVTLDKEQQEILSSVQHNRRTSVASGTARGKDFVAADWNGFDLSAFFQGSFGADVFDALRRYELAAVNYTSDALERWTGPGTSNSMPRIVLGDTPKNFRPSTLLVHDASFLRLRNLQVGYTLPAQLTRKAYIQRLRFYASFDNLLTITGYKGMDPEIGSTMGIDKGVYPQARVYTFGLNLTF